MRFLLLAVLLFWPLTATAQHQCGTLGHARHDPEALAAFLSVRAAGTLPRVAAKSAADPAIGDQQIFNVSESPWTPKTFELRAKADAFYIWVEIGELANGNVEPANIDALKASLVEATPDGSFNSERGVLANNIDIFGEPPNYDGDGIVDVLLYNIAPEQDNAASFTGGYVSAADISPSAGDGVGNQADILYLDSFQGTRNLVSLSAFAAHEFTHLIHFNYGFDPETFVSEGMAEYAIVMNGYDTWRRISYLSNPAEYRLPLFTWRDDAGPALEDYQRSGLFMSYIAERVGAQRAGEIVRMENKGAVGIDSLLTADGLSLAGVTLDFHTANLLMDPSIDDGRFGYSRDFSFIAEPSIVRNVDGTAATNTPETLEGDEPTIQGLATDYIRFSEVSNLSLSYDAYLPAIVIQIQPALLDDVRSRLSGRALTRDLAGTLSMTDFVAGSAPTVLPGNHSDVTLILTSGKAEIVSKYSLAAFWQQGGAATPSEQDPSLPESVSLSAAYPNPFNPVTTITYQLPSAMMHRLAVYDVLGREVAVLVDGVREAGEHAVRFQASGLPSGIYLYALEAGGASMTKTVMLLK